MERCFKGLLILVLLLSGNAYGAYKEGTFTCQWVIDLGTIKKNDLSQIPNIGRVSNDPALNTSVLEGGGTSWALVRASTYTDQQNTFVLAKEADGSVIRYKSEFVGTCEDIITGIKNPCVWGERFYNPLPMDFGKDYSLEVSTP